MNIYNRIKQKLSSNSPRAEVKPASSSELISFRDGYSLVHNDSGSQPLLMTQFTLPDGRSAQFYSDPDAVINNDFGNYQDAYDSWYEDSRCQNYPPDNSEETFDVILIEGEPLPLGFSFEKNLEPNLWQAETTDINSRFTITKEDREYFEPVDVPAI